MTMSLSALTLVSNTVVIQCACYSDVHPQHIIFTQLFVFDLFILSYIQCIKLQTGYLYYILCPFWFLIKNNLLLGNSLTS